MAWVVLVTSAFFEAVWATALGEVGGSVRLVPTLALVVGLTASLSGLGWAMKVLPVSIAYSVWVGIGAALTVVVAMVRGEEAASAARIVLTGGIIACVIGLKLVGSGGTSVDTGPGDHAGETALKDTGLGDGDGGPRR